MAGLYSREHLSSSSLTVWPFDPASNVPAEVCRLFSDCAVDLPASSFESSAPEIGQVSVGHRQLSFRFRESPSSEESAVVYDVEDRDGYGVVRSGRAVFVIDNAHVLDSGLEGDGGWYRICGSCLFADIPKVESLSLWNARRGGFLSRTVAGIRGDVALLPGRNMEVEDSQGGIRLSASPGAGQGRVECGCEDGEGGWDGELVPDDTGSLAITGDSCYQITDQGNNTLRIDGRCSACCPIESCVGLAEELRGMNDTLRSGRDGVLGAASDLAEAIEDDNDALYTASDKDFVPGVYLTTPRSKVSMRGTKIKGSFGVVRATCSVENRSNAVAMHVEVLAFSIPGYHADLTYRAKKDDDGYAYNVYESDTPEGKSFDLKPGGKWSFTSSFWPDRLTFEGPASRRSVAGTAVFSVSWRNRRKNPDGSYGYDDVSRTFTATSAASEG